jgi:hypothetical protein
MATLAKRSRRSICHKRLRGFLGGLLDSHDEILASQYAGRTQLQVANCDH